MNSTCRSGVPLDGLFCLFCCTSILTSNFNSGSLTKPSTLTLIVHSRDGSRIFSRDGGSIGFSIEWNRNERKWINTFDEHSGMHTYDTSSVKLRHVPELVELKFHHPDPISREVAQSTYREERMIHSLRGGHENWMKNLTAQEKNVFGNRVCEGTTHCKGLDSGADVASQWRGRAAATRCLEAEAALFVAERIVIKTMESQLRLKRIDCCESLDSERIHLRINDFAGSRGPPTSVQKDRTLERWGRFLACTKT